MCFLLILLPCCLSCLSRDQNEVLAEDREKLRVLQPLQPWFSQEQREELAEVHSWIQQNTIPEEINTQVHFGTHIHIYCSHLSTGFYIINFLPLRVVTAVGQLQEPPALRSLLLPTARLLRRSPSRKLLDPTLKFDWRWFHNKFTTHLTKSTPGGLGGSW